MSFTILRPERGSITIFIVMVLLATAILPFASDTFSALEDTTGELSVVKRIEDVSIHSTSIAMNRKVMDWNGNDLFLAYIHDNDQGARSAKLIVSGDRGRTWSDPVTVWPYVQCYAMKVDILIDNGTLFYFINIREEEDWETWSIQAYDVPVHDWYNITYFQPTRIDDRYSGYSSHSQALKFKDRVFYFRTRSHYVDLPYRVYENGEWGVTGLIDSGTYISYFAAVSSDISGTETIYFVYQYYNKNRVYLTTSIDGLNWTSAMELHYFHDAPQRLSLVEHNNGLHLIINERNGYDVYHAFTRNGENWSGFRKIGENTENAASSIRPVPDDVSLVSNGTTMIAAFDHDDGIEVMVYDGDQGEFVHGTFLKNGTSRYPTFDTRGVFLAYHENENVLVIRSFGSFEPDPDSDPVDPDDDDQEDPYTPVNDPDPPGEWDNLEPPGEPEMFISSEDDGNENTVRLEAFIPRPGDYPEDEINFTWTVEGLGEVGYGPSILLELPPGDHRVTLRVEYSEGKFVESSRWLRMGEEPEFLRDGDEAPAFQPVIMVAIVIILLSLVLITIFGLIFKRKKERETSRGGRSGESRGVNISDGPHRSVYPDQEGLVTSGRIGDLDPVPTTGSVAGAGARSISPSPHTNVNAQERTVSLSDLWENSLTPGYRRSKTSMKDEILESTLLARERGEISDEAFRAVDDILHMHD